MRKNILAVVCLAACVCVPAFGQYHVDARNRGQRIIVISPMTGAGTPTDPKRPLLMPPSSAIGKAGGIQEVSCQVSDDGQYAILELVARDRSAFAAILADSRALRRFEKGKDRKEDIERELRRYKRDFGTVPGLMPGAAQ